MPIHEEVLKAARRIASTRGDWTFTPVEIVRALPHLNQSSVRTHVVSRCCVNAPKNHPHKWDYFRRIGRGRYLVLPPHRGGLSRAGATRGGRDSSKPPTGLRIAEARPQYDRRHSRLLETIHAVVTRDGEFYVAECLEVAVVTQWRTLDEVLANLRGAVSLHLEGDDAEAIGVASAPRLTVTYEVPMSGDAREA